MQSSALKSEGNRGPRQASHCHFPHAWAGGGSSLPGCGLTSWWVYGAPRRLCCGLRRRADMTFLLQRGHWNCVKQQWGTGLPPRRLGDHLCPESGGFCQQAHQPGDFPAPATCEAVWALMVKSYLGPVKPLKSHAKWCGCVCEFSVERINSLWHHSREVKNHCSVVS